MADMRHGILLREFDPPAGTAVSALAYEYRAGTRVGDHAHGADQLIYATKCIMEVSSEQRIWTILPQFALWIPAGTVHRTRVLGAVYMHSLYFRKRVVPRRPAQGSVLYVAPLLRELILQAVRRGRLKVRKRLDCALRDPLSAKLVRATEPRALAVAHLIAQNLAHPRSLAQVCTEAGVSLRTVQRIYRREVGGDLEAWRRHVRVIQAIQLLVAGQSVKEVAYAVGYRHPSAFVQVFRGLFGKTPKAWTTALCGTYGISSGM